MSVNEWNASPLIEGIRAEHRLARKHLPIGGAATALSSLKRLQEQTETLHESHANLIREQLLILEPLLRHVNRLPAKLAADGASPEARGGQTPDRKEENAIASKRS